VVLRKYGKIVRGIKYHKYSSRRGKSYIPQKEEKLTG
jgi:hypothetical protein